MVELWLRNMANMVIAPMVLGYLMEYRLALNQMWLAGHIPHMGKVLGGKPSRNARELPRLIPFDDWNIYTYMCIHTHTHLITRVTYRHIYIYIYINNYVYICIYIFITNPHNMYIIIYAHYTHISSYFYISTFMLCV